MYVNVFNKVEQIGRTMQPHPHWGTGEHVTAALSLSFSAIARSHGSQANTVQFLLLAVISLVILCLY